MNRSWKALLIIVAQLPVALLTTSAFTQTASTHPISDATTQVTAAWVYVLTTHGVDAYDAAADGKLTLLKGSPFKVTGTIVANNGSHLITLGDDLVHSYAVESNGAIGKQVSQINSQDYDGSRCGNLNGAQAVLDHTGRNLYVQIVANNNAPCAAVQTYDVGKGSGQLSFAGAAVDTDFPADALADNDCCTRLTITGNDDFAYSVTEQGTFWNGSLIGYRRQSDGALQRFDFNETDPPAQAGQGYGPTYTPPLAVAADPAGHLAALTQGYVDGQSVMQLASYTVDKEGNISSTNTWENMPKVSVADWPTGDEFSPALSMSPSGKLLAVETSPQCQNCDTPWGFQLFHFNGAAPITHYSPILLSNVIVRQMSWDKNNHLYVLGTDLGVTPAEVKLYVFTVTPTTIAQDSGSPYLIKNPANGLVVVSR